MKELHIFVYILPLLLIDICIQMSDSLLQRSMNLSAIALESFIYDITSKQENLAFEQLLSHPYINTVSKDVYEILRLFAKGTFRDYLSNKYRVGKLSEKQLSTLRRLSLLSQIQGLQTIEVSRLQSALNADSDQIINIILSMNISSQLNARIDQQTNKITILSSQVRQNGGSYQSKQITIRLQEIMKKNYEVQHRSKQILRQLH